MLSTIVNQTKKLTHLCKGASIPRDFLDLLPQEPACQKLVKQLTKLKPEDLGLVKPQEIMIHDEIKQKQARMKKDQQIQQKYLHKISPQFTQPKEGITRTVWTEDEGYSLVLIQAAAGTKISLHDHPNMAVMLRMLYGKARYWGFDKIDQKFQHERISQDELSEMIETHKRVSIQPAMSTMLLGPNSLMMRPSFNNMHEFYMLEDTAFIDVILHQAVLEGSRCHMTTYRKVGGLLRPMPVSQPKQSHNSKQAADMFTMIYGIRSETLADDTFMRFQKNDELPKKLRFVEYDYPLLETPAVQRRSIREQSPLEF